MTETLTYLGAAPWDRGGGGVAGRDLGEGGGEGAGRGAYLARPERRGRGTGRRGRGTGRPGRGSGARGEVARRGRGSGARRRGSLLLLLGRGGEGAAWKAGGEAWKAGGASARAPPSPASANWDWDRMGIGGRKEETVKSFTWGAKYEWRTRPWVRHSYTNMSGIPALWYATDICI